MALPFDSTNVVRKTYFINESERSVDPNDDEGKLVQLEEDGFLSASFVRSTLSFDTFDLINGASLPVPVFINSDGTLLRSAANTTGRLKFHGFSISADTAPLLPRFIASGQGAATFALNAPAGNNRYVLVATVHAGATSVPASGVTWNGIAMTQIDLKAGTSIQTALWGLVIGSDVSITTANVVATGGAGSTYQSWQGAIYENVDQTTPYADIDGAGDASTTVTSPSLTASDPNSLFVYSGATNGSASISLTVAGTTTQLDSSNNRAKLGDFRLVGNSTFTVTSPTSSGIVVVGLVFNAAAAVPNSIISNTTISGFTGLTPGANYYVQDTIGTIGTTPGTTSILVGYALSATTLLVKT